MNYCKTFFAGFVALAILAGVVCGFVAGGVWLVGAVFRAYDIESCNRSARICEQWADAHGGQCAECKEAKACKARGVI